MAVGDRTMAYLAGFVLCDLVLSVLFAILALAVGAACLGNVDLYEREVVSHRLLLTSHALIAVRDSMNDRARCQSRSIQSIKRMTIE